MVGSASVTTKGSHVSYQVGVDEVNLWQPGGKTLSRALKQRVSFLVKFYTSHHLNAGSFFAPARNELLLSGRGTLCLSQTSVV